MSDQNTSSSSASTVTLDATERKHLSHIAHLAAYRALQRCAAIAVQQIDQLGSKNHQIILVNRLVDERDKLIISLSQTLLEELQAQLNQQSDEQQQKRDSKERTEGAAFALLSPALNNVQLLLNTITGLTNSVTTLMSLFRTDYTLYPISTSIDADTVRAVFAHHLKQNHWQVYTFPPSESATAETSGSVTQLLKELAPQLFTLVQKPDQLAKLNTRGLEILSLLASDLHTFLFGAQPTSSTSTSAAVTTSEGSNQSTATTVVKHTATAESFLSRALLAERLLQAKSGTTYRFYQLAARVTQVGSDMIARKNLFSAGRLTFIGGCTLEYVLATPEGEIVAANIVQSSEQIKLNLGLNVGWDESMISFKTLSETKQ